MDVGVAIVALTLLALVVRFIGAPLRDRRAPDANADAGEREALEAAREAKYREIRDLELDFRTGKLSPADYEATNAQLRSEAIQILDRLERAESVRTDAKGSEVNPGTGGRDDPGPEGDGSGPEGEGVRPRDA